MSAATTRSETISARVTPDLKADIEEVAKRYGEADLSYAIRRALRRYVDAELDRGPLGAAGLLAGGQGSARRNGTPTERAAALGVAPRIGTARFLALEVFEANPRRGATADEVNIALAPRPQNSTARRVTDLLQGGLIREAATEPGGDIIVPHGTELVTRQTRHGAQGQVYVITGAGRGALDVARRARAAKERQS